jgi:hydroxylaminobenzene mutase
VDQVLQLPRAVKGTAYWTALYGLRELARYDARSSLWHRGAITITPAGHTGKPWQESLVTTGFLSVGIAIAASSLLLLLGTGG